MASPATPARPALAAGRPLPASPALRLAAGAVAAAACAVGAWLGAWWVPFVAGVAAGRLAVAGPRPRRGCVLPAAAGAAGGWLIVLWLLALDGQPAGATARTIAALAGLPPYAWLAVTAVAVLAVLQVLAGCWLARAVMPRTVRDSRTGTAADPRAGTAADPQG
jgi:hypothetical protein